MPEHAASPRSRFADLAAACIAGDLATITAYLDRGGRANRADDEGETLLHYAARAGQAAMVKLLVDAGADPSVANSFGETPRDVATRTPLWGSTSDGAAGEANMLPQLDGDDLVFTFDVRTEHEHASYAIEHAGVELFRVPLAFDDAAPFEAGAQRLRDAYAGRVRDLVPSDGAERALFGESSAAARGVEAVRHALRTDSPLPDTSRAAEEVAAATRAAGHMLQGGRPVSPAPFAPSAAVVGECPGAVLRVAVSADGRFVAASHSRGVDVWSTSSGERVGSIGYAPSALVLGFLADPLQMVLHDSSAPDGHAYVHAVSWADRSTRVIVDLEKPELLRAAAVAPDGRIVAVVLRSHIVCVDGITGATISTSRWIELDFEAFDQQVACAFTSGGTNVTVVRYGNAKRDTFGTRPFGEVLVTTAAEGAHVSAVHTRTRLPGLVDPVPSPAGDVIIDRGDGSGRLELRDAVSLERRGLLSSETAGACARAISPSGTWAVCTRDDAGGIQVVDLRSGASVVTASLPVGDQVTSCAVSPDERWAALGTGLGRVLRVGLPAATGAPVVTALDGDARAALAAVTADPDADEPRIAYVRWLETARRGEPEAAARADLIRLQLPWAPWEDDGHSLPAPPNPLRRQQEILSMWGERWASSIAPLVRSYRFHRGFVEQVEVDASTFLEHHDELYAAAPIRHLLLVDVGPLLEEVVRSPALRRIRSLSITSQPIGDDGVRLLASSSQLAALRWLDLSQTGAGLEGLHSLAESPHLRSLLYLEWNGNACETPSPNVYSDWDGGTAHWQETSVGLHIRERYGDIAWTQLIGGVRWPPRPGDL